MLSLMLSEKRRILAVFAVCCAAFILTGCGASVTVYDYTSDGVRYNMYELEFDKSIINGMEQSAVNDADGNKYTVAGYLYTLFCDFGYELTDAEDTGEKYTVRYRKAVGGRSELFEAGTPVAFKTDSTENPFIRTYTSISPNPFNGVRQKYDAVAPGQSLTVLDRLKNGSVARDEFGELVVAYPSLADAFPYIKRFDPDGLLLKYVRYGSPRTLSSGASSGGKTAAFVYSRYFDDTYTNIELSYKRAVPYGWYLTALAAGAVTLAIFAAATRTKKDKKKPTLLDRFPYDPEEYRDYENRFPANR